MCSSDLVMTRNPTPEDMDTLSARRRLAYFLARWLWPTALFLALAPWWLLADITHIGWWAWPLLAFILRLIVAIPMVIGIWMYGD